MESERVLWIKGFVYINSFLKGKEGLSKTRDELINGGYYLTIHGNDKSL